MAQKYQVFLGMLVIVIVVTILRGGVFLSPNLDESGDTTGQITESQRDCGPNRCPLNKYRLNSSNCKCIFIGDITAEESSPPVDSGDGVTYTTSFSPCNRELGDRGFLLEGVNTIRWLDSTTMGVNVIATANCVSGIKSQGVTKEGEDITLWYSTSTPSPDDSRGVCTCGHELMYKLSNVDREENYNIIIQELQ